MLMSLSISYGVAHVSHLGWVGKCPLKPSTLKCPSGAKHQLSIDPTLSDASHQSQRKQNGRLNSRTLKDQPREFSKAIMSVPPNQIDVTCGIQGGVWLVLVMEETAPPSPNKQPRESNNLSEKEPVNMSRTINLSCHYNCCTKASQIYKYFKFFLIFYYFYIDLFFKIILTFSELIF